jgi:hypothetical protein
MRSFDSAEYLRLASSLHQGSYGSVTANGLEPEALRPPGYPAFLWLLIYGLRFPLALVVATQLLMYLASLWLIARSQRHEKYLPQMFLVLAAAYVFAPLYISAIMAEGVATLAVTCVAVLVAVREGRIGLRLTAIGLICGIAALFRPDLILLPVWVSGVLGLQVLWERRSALLTSVTVGGVLKAAIPTAVAMAVLLPYAAWNYKTFERFSPLPVGGAVGNSLYLATWQNVLPPEDLNALYQKQATPNAQRAGLIEEVSRLNTEIGAHPLTAPWFPGEYPDRATQIRSGQVFGRAAVQRIRERPADFAWHVVSNGVWRLWNTSRYPPYTPAIAILPLMLLSGIIGVLGIAGVVLTLIRPRNWPLSSIQALVFLYLPLVHVWLHTEARYTAPVRPLLLLYAAVTLLWIWRALRARREGDAPAASPASALDRNGASLVPAPLGS